MHDLAAIALDTARSAGATWADVRIIEERTREVFVMRRSLKQLTDRSRVGCGVRVLVDGAWGFASDTRLTAGDIPALAARAVAAARASARSPREPRAAVAFEGAHVDTRVGPCAEDPFAVPLAEHAAMLVEACSQMLDVPHIVDAIGRLVFLRTGRIYANTDGTRLDLTNTFIDPHLSCTAVIGAESQGRQYQGGARQAGCEFLREIDLVGNAKGWALEAVDTCRADDGPIGVMDLVLDPAHLALTMHESVGHPTESDRILGWEANMAGRSFVRPSDVDELVYGSPLVNFTADSTLPEGTASCFYDDDGVPMQRFPVIREGRLVDLGLTRETAVILGRERSNGCSRAQSFDFAPINRIPNLWMEPGGDDAVTAKDLIAGVDRGVYIQGRGSFSIDQMRRNFQFGGDRFFAIEGGRLTRPLKKVTYQSQTTDFWRSCDGVAGAHDWRSHGTMNCGKGEPMQINRMTHGSSHARFRGILLGDGRR